MTQLLHIEEDGLQIVLEIADDGDVRLLHCSALPFDANTIGDPSRHRAFRIVEIQVTGENQDDHHGSKHTGTLPGKRLRYVRHADTRTEQGRKLEVVQEDAVTGLVVTSHLQFCAGVPMVQAWTSVTNDGAAPLGLEYVSSFALTGLAKEGLQPWHAKMWLSVPHNSWYGEVQWRTDRLPALGLSEVNSFSLKRLAFTNTGTWSTSQYLPMGYLENRESGANLFWQIEHNGSWHWELSDIARDLYLQLSGPTENEHHWWRSLQPGETFESVPVAVGSTPDGFTSAMAVLTRYRRSIRRPNRDNEALPVIFNDYMTTLGHPTTEKLLPLIDAAANVGSEYFVIDAGWYADGEWWDGVGEWLPSQRRFPGGIREVLNYIRNKGMIPGLWLEIEVMGTRCPIADQVPDDWFFCRHGRRVIDHGRYQLDFRNPRVVDYANSVIDRLVDDYGVGYIKMDYNINAGLGTEIGADSFGEGLLEHNRAYLAWLDSVFAHYPELVIENCSSGGMRMDYALLRRHSIQSSSDQYDYRKVAVIAAAAPSALTPEQCAVWSFPQADADEETIIFNMVNALLLRVHQSGHLVAFDERRLGRVREALDYYKRIRSDLARGVPIWPLGLPTFSDEWVALAIVCEGTTYLAVWRMASTSDTCVLPLEHLIGDQADVDCAYPSSMDCGWQWQAEAGALSVRLPQNYCARIFRIRQISAPTD